ncbi:uncharacterized protein LOC111379980 [Olea europaea var. sylvestris]|uniref:uncharacterized protein LOC111379980 n=1 Tax=Olea europaea var. sylvestris TaxID=158386 RepID=UPI000C1D6324|nr:uncharacterized protein LOC111379980 [Olea europaea var. sylvestris]
MYLAVLETAVSRVLVRQEDEKQLPIYYVSKALLDAETRYSQLEKLALSLVSATRKLRPYFQSHSIVLADFIVDFAPNSQVLAQRELLCLADGPVMDIWMLQVDRSRNINGAGLGIFLTSPEGDQIQQAVRYEFKATNNEAECKALIAGLVLGKEIGITRIHVYYDSQLIVNQIQGTFLAKDTKIASYLELAKQLCKEFDEFHITQVPPTKNIQADALASLEATTNTKQSKVIPIVYLQWPAVRKSDENNIIYSFEEQSWMTPIIRNLQNDELPPDKNEARQTKAKVSRFYIIDSKLYRRSFFGPYLRCISNAKVKYVLAKLHEGECGNHSGAWSLAHRTLTAGSYWPTMRTDSVNHIKKCDRCQRFANVSHLPPEWINPVLLPWPFMKWGMDIMENSPLLQDNEFSCWQSWTISRNGMKSRHSQRYMQGQIQGLAS